MEGRDRLLRILSRYQKNLVVKDLEDVEVELIINYPTIEDSVDFWDIMYTINQNANKGADAEKNATELSSIILPKIVNYVLKSIEKKEGKELDKIEKEYYYILIMSNAPDVINAFMEMTNLIFNKGDAPKNINLAAPLQTE